MPSYYADMPITIKEIQESERNYIKQYDKAKFITDLKYFFQAFYNIGVKRVRSS